MLTQEETVNQVKKESGKKLSRCYSSKIQLSRNDDAYQALLITHEIFNHAVERAIRKTFEVVKGREGDDFARLTKWAIKEIPAKECSTHFFNPFTIDNSSLEAGGKHSAFDKEPGMRSLFFKAKEEGKKIYNDQEIFLDIPQDGLSSLKKEVNQQVAEKIKAYFELLDIWGNGSESSKKAKKTSLIHIQNPNDFTTEISNAINNFKKNDILDDEFINQASVNEDLKNLLRNHTQRSFRRDINNFLNDLFENKLLREDEILDIESFINEYSSENIGKSEWLIRKKSFDKNNSDFIKIYNDLLERYRSLQVNQKTAKSFRLPLRWKSDPNFLKVVDEFFSNHISYKDLYKSPLLSLELKTWCDNQKIPSDYSCLNTKEGRKKFLNALESLNGSLLFNQATSFFRQLNYYRQFEPKINGKKYTEFKRPPAFRFPDPYQHPEWISFSAKGNMKYRDLIFRSTKAASVDGSIRVKLLTPCKTKWEFYTLDLKFDSRLKNIKSLQVDQTEDKTSVEYSIPNKEGINEKLDFKGANLIYKNKNFYLNFRYETAKTFSGKIKINNSSSSPYKAGTRLLGVDLGQKADAVISIYELIQEVSGQETSIHEHLKPIKFKPFTFSKKNKQSETYYQWIKIPGGGSFTAINHAEKLRSIKRKQHAKKLEKNSDDPTIGHFLSRNQESFKSLNKYISNCKDQHCKQVAGALMKIALENKCHGIVLEDLKSYQVSSKLERSENRRLGIWSLQKKIDLLEALQKSAGKLVLKTNASYTSQICHQCGSYGVRFNILDKKQKKYEHEKIAKEANIQRAKISAGGDWFLCSNQNCHGKKEDKEYYTIQADANASRNLLIKLYLRQYWSNIKSRIPTNEEKETIKEELQKYLNKTYPSKIAASIEDQRRAVSF
ncbi:MAG: transposase [Cyanobacteria bacterium REEB446]|nr:transposase [Cyanobacteria bacterium REEB446]